MTWAGAHLRDAMSTMKSRTPSGTPLEAELVVLAVLIVVLVMVIVVLVNSSVDVLVIVALLWLMWLLCGCSTTEELLRGCMRWQSSPAPSWQFLSSLPLHG